MSLSKKTTLTIKDYSITLSSPLKFYKNDTLDLVFNINEYGIEIKNGISTFSLMPINALNAKLLIECDGGKDFIEATAIVDNTITFRLDSKYSQYQGVGKMQIVLLDNDGCKITLPEFDYEIKESINANWDSNIQVVMKIISTENGKALTDERGNLMELIKLSELPEASSLTDTDYVMITQNGESKKVKTNLFKGTVEIVNDLTTGGIDKALSAEQGKVIKLQLDSITTEVNHHITNHPTGGSGTLNKLEILEVEPSGDGLYEGRIWIYKAPDLSCTNITLSSNTLTFTNKESQTLTYITVPSNTSDSVMWDVNPKGIAIVDDGVVTPKANGECTITVTCGTQSATCNVSISGLEEITLPMDNLLVWADAENFTNSPQTTTLIDKSGNSNNFTATGFDYTTSSGLNDNNKIVFDGINDKLVSGTISFDISNGFTIIFKGSINNLSQSNEEVVDCTFTDSMYNKQLSIIYGYVANTIELYGNGLDFRTGSQITINDTGIHTIIYSYDGSLLKGYLDNVEVISVSKSITLNTPINKLAIGGNLETNYANITLDKFLLYNRVLSIDEINLFNS